MDPLTLFALANGAVQAVKKGCQLYKDIKGAAGDVKAVLKDLDDQFANNHKDKPATVAQRNAYIEEKNRVIELNKKQGETAGIYQELANYLGDFFDNMNKCMAVIEEEERKNREEIYEGEESLGRRALQLVIMKKQLEQMVVELREMMIFQAPPELGALWTDVSEMMKEMGGQQRVLISRKMQAEERAAARRRQRMKHYAEELTYAGMMFIMGITITLLMAYISHDRKQRWPELEPAVIEQKREERKRIRLMELQEWQASQQIEDEYYQRQIQKSSDTGAEKSEAQQKQ